jgi:excisionase family DNA binding protein
MHHIQIQNFTVAELRALFQEIIAIELANAISNLPNSPPTNSIDKLMSMKEAAVYLGISIPTLMKMVKEKRLIGKRIGKRLKFNIQNLNQLK